MPNCLSAIIVQLQHERGATLVELALVVTLIALLAAPLAYQLGWQSGDALCSAAMGESDRNHHTYNPDNAIQPCENEDHFSNQNDQNPGWGGGDGYVQDPGQQSQGGSGWM